MIRMRRFRNRPQSQTDHRIAMSSAVPGLALYGQEIVDEGSVAKSFPQFWQGLSEFV
jgi:5-enolpyruvylshikimate-3-phosphate synthase